MKASSSGMRIVGRGVLVSEVVSVVSVVSWTILHREQQPKRELQITAHEKKAIIPEKKVRTNIVKNTYCLSTYF